MSWRRSSCKSLWRPLLALSWSGHRPWHFKYAIPELPTLTPSPPHSAPTCSRRQAEHDQRVAAEDAGRHLAAPRRPERLQAPDEEEQHAEAQAWRNQTTAHGGSTFTLGSGTLLAQHRPGAPAGLVGTRAVVASTTYVNRPIHALRCVYFTLAFVPQEREAGFCSRQHLHAAHWASPRRR
jgi:hypothetical protein